MNGDVHPFIHGNNDIKITHKMRTNATYKLVFYDVLINKKWLIL